MKRLSILSIPLSLCLILWAAAHGAGPSSDEATKHRQLERNRALIRDLVASGIRLAQEEDPLLRADCCHSLAERVVDEIQHAATGQDMDRAVQLSEHLHLVVKLGVANNLRTVRFESTPNSTREVDVQRVGAQVRELIDPLEELLQGREPDGADLRRALRRVRDAQAEVERLLRVRNNP
jgi:hypothetical protein